VVVTGGLPSPGIAAYTSSASFLESGASPMRSKILSGSSPRLYARTTCVCRSVLGGELFGNLGSFFQIRKQELDKAIGIGKERVFDPVLRKIPVIHRNKLRRQGNVPIFFGLFPAVFDPDFRTVGV